MPAKAVPAHHQILWLSGGSGELPLIDHARIELIVTRRIGRGYLGDTLGEGVHIAMSGDEIDDLPPVLDGKSFISSESGLNRRGGIDVPANHVQTDGHEEVLAGFPHRQPLTIIGMGRERLGSVDTGRHDRLG